MAKVSKIFGAVGKIFFILAFIGIGILCIAMAYIMFAPDQLAKAVYIGLFRQRLFSLASILNSLIGPRPLLNRHPTAGDGPNACYQSG